MTDFEYIVVGNGLFGSASARYLSEHSANVAIIGPDEPEDEKNHDGVYSSHYDARRTVRLLARSKINCEIGRRAIDNFRMLEEKSGIRFYDAVGCLIVNSDLVQDNNLESPKDLVDTLNITHTFYQAGNGAWRSSFPDFNFPESHWIIYEPAPAGVIDPRAMLRAQNVMAKKQGAVIIPEIVVDVREDASGVRVETRSGATFRAKKVLVTVGAFTNCFNLFPTKLPLTPETEIIILGQVSASEAARLRNMPALSYFVKDKVIQDVYMTPPAQYPDGNYYIKMGANTPKDFNPENLAGIQKWFKEGGFQKGNSDFYLEDMARVLRNILPEVEFLAFQIRRCIITKTESKYPIIDQITERTFLASGANGSGAKSADFFGSLAAGLTRDGRWQKDIPRSLFCLS